MDNNCLPDSQLFPVQPCVHTQVKESFLTRHNPSFWQGELLHTWVTSIQKKRNIFRCALLVCYNFHMVKYMILIQSDEYFILVILKNHEITKTKKTIFPFLLC